MKIILRGDPILTKKSKEVSKINKNLKDVAISMIKYGKTVKNCVGLAGCQIGDLRRICVAEIDDEWKIIINPKIVQRSSKLSEEWEGCMSLKEGNLFGKVKRPEKIIVEYMDESGKKRLMQFTGFYSHLLQHEIDHMNGLMFLDRMEDPASLLTDKELEVIYADTDKEE
jgi:peptide deformylase